MSKLIKRIVILRRNNLFILLALPVLLYTCREIGVPKPKGYFRIDLPAKNYVIFDNSLSKAGNIPLTFEYPSYGRISTDPTPFAGPGWFNIEIPSFRATIYLTYINIHNDLDSVLEQNYQINIKNHITKADAIDEQTISIPAKKVYGTLYDLKGSTATAVQFFVTDSTRNYLRGSLYFSAEPNPDSLAPLINFFRQDILHIIETLKWNDK
jgi:gliding motility-associated lipoprotein GldD